MNIGIVCYPTLGGSGVVATELGKALARKGNQVHFIAYRRPFRLDLGEDNIEFHKVEISDYDLFEYPPYGLSLTNKIVEIAVSQDLDLLHVHYAIPHASCAYSARQILAAKNKSLPFITTLHGTDITLIGKEPSLNEVITFAMNQSEILTTVSESLKNDTLKHFKIEKEIHVVPNFVCSEEYQQDEDIDLRRKYAEDDEKVILHVSNFRPVKKVEDVVRVFALVRKSLKCKLVLVGDGPDAKLIEQLCKELGVCNDTVRVGKLKDVRKMLSIADLFLLTSETESFGLVALEAMASGVPVISTNTGGIPEVNIHGKTGYLSSVGDVTDMAKNALVLLENQQTLEEFQANALKQARAFDIENILPRYEHLYQQLL
jgi:N-acetyl-alpha-D-glucosaminyl L-malate synthase BshA